MPTEKEQIETLKRQLHEALETVDQISQFGNMPTLEVRWPFLFTAFYTGYEQGGKMLEEIKALNFVDEARIDGGDRTTQQFFVSVNQDIYKDLFSKINAIVTRNAPPSGRG